MAGEAHAMSTKQLSQGEQMWNEDITAKTMQCVRMQDAECMKILVV